jgi:hypothetical protein
MSKKTKKQPEKKATKTTPAPKAKAARAEPKKAAAKAKEAAPATPKLETTTTNAPAAPHEPDPRLPALGTLLQKRDRHGAVRCECTVEETGIRYAGAIYKSLSAAAMAAAKDLGLTNKTQNGFVFWGLSKPPRRASDPLETIERSWTRYHDQVTALLKGGVTDDNRVQVAATIAEHLQAFESLRERVA